MKNKILLLSVLFFSACSAFSQQVKMGTTAGVTMYSIRGDVSKSLDKILGATNGIVTTRPVTGFYGGSYANIPVTENFSIEPGLYYATKGYAVQRAYTFKALIF